MDDCYRGGDAAYCRGRRVACNGGQKSEVRFLSEPEADNRRQRAEVGGNLY
jgi:hypothetical protein